MQSAESRTTQWDSSRVKLHSPRTRVETQRMLTRGVVDILQRNETLRNIKEWYEKYGPPQKPASATENPHTAR